MTNIHSRRGQTLVEALVALSILTTGFVGIVALLTKSFQLNRTTSNDTQATYLAAEGIEITKSLIDHDVYTGLSVGSDDWDQCFDLNPAGGVGYFKLAYDTTTCPPPAYSGPTDYLSDPLYFDPSSTLYSYNPTSFNAVKTDFTRMVKITDNGNEFDVQSIVTWADGGLSNTVTLEDHFYDYL
jgi:type II secretory pathway pseudopilin PulG